MLYLRLLDSFDGIKRMHDNVSMPAPPAKSGTKYEA